jgi:myosin heavy subunit
MDAIAQKELDDLVLLDEINEENVVAALKTRYQNGNIYSFIGA